MTQLSTLYLVLFNTLCSVGWMNVTRILYDDIFAKKLELPDIYDSIIPLVIQLQLVASLELLHSRYGLVKGSPFQTLMQLVGRDMALVALVLLRKSTVTQSTWGFLLMISSWSLSENIRYPYYTLHVMRGCPRILTWLRYSAFIILYPCGFVGEFMMMWDGMSTVKALFGTGPLAVFSAYVLLAFGWGAPTLYFHMLRKRKGNLKGVIRQNRTKQPRRSLTFQQQQTKPQQQETPSSPEASSSPLPSYKQAQPTPRLPLAPSE